MIKTKNDPGDGIVPVRVISEFVPFLVDAVQQMRNLEISCSLKNVWKVADFDAVEFVKNGEEKDAGGTDGLNRFRGVGALLEPSSMNMEGESARRFF